MQYLRQQHHDPLDQPGQCRQRRRASGCLHGQGRHWHVGAGQAAAQRRRPRSGPSGAGRTPRMQSWPHRSPLAALQPGTCQAGHACLWTLLGNKLDHLPHNNLVHLPHNNTSVLSCNMTTCKRVELQYWLLCQLFCIPPVRRQGMHKPLPCIWWQVILPPRLSCGRLMTPCRHE